MSKLWVQIHKNGSADAQNKCIHYDQSVKTLGNRLMIVFWCAIGLPARGAGFLIPLLSCWHANSIRSTSLGGNLIHWGNVLFHSGLLKICLISRKIHENFISYMLTFTSRCYTTNSLVHQSSSSVVCHHWSIKIRLITSAKKRSKIGFCFEMGIKGAAKERSWNSRKLTDMQQQKIKINQKKITNFT